MKKSFILIFAAFFTLLWLCGCLGINLGGGSKTDSKTEIHKTTLGQELLDLQKAKEAGAITDAEFQVQKAKLLEHR